MLHLEQKSPIPLSPQKPSCQIDVPMFIARIKEDQGQKRKGCLITIVTSV